MIAFATHTLKNGLRLIHHYDAATPMVAVNLLLNVGSSYEKPDKTGLAHLMEHLMFTGSKNAPRFDEMLERAGGDSNAWTSIDVTNYYEVLPASNLETALWLESDRISNLLLSDESIAVQKSVVIEEFKQRYLNQPYGDVLHLTHGQAYLLHPYRWPTIGLDVNTIEGFMPHDVKDFYRRHYSVSNAVLCISGNVDFDTAAGLVEKWFGDIPGRDVPKRALPAEPQQEEYRFMTHRCNVPSNMIFRCYHMCGRAHDLYPATDLLSDVLGNGTSSRFHKELIQGSNAFADIDASVLGSRDPGLFYIRARLTGDVSFEEADKAIDATLKRLMDDGISQREVEKYVNKFISNRLFENVGYAEKAVALCRHELLWGASQINEEIERYRKVTPSQIQDVASRLLNKRNCSTIYYGPDA